MVFLKLKRTFLLVLPRRLGSEGGGMRGVAIGLALVLGGAAAAWAVPASRIERMAQDLVIDGVFDLDDAERLVRLAWSDDLLVDGQESGALLAVVRRYGLRDAELPGVDAPATPGVERARRLMVQALRAGIGRTEYRRAMQQLIALAISEDLTRDDRYRVLELVDRYREVDPAVGTRDALDAIALLLTNPTEARRDREHRRQLELLEKQFQIPVFLDPASRSLR